MRREQGRSRGYRRIDLNRMVEFIADYQNTSGESPTVREIGRAMGDRSPSVIQYSLDKLERSGRIVREQGQARSITLISRGESSR